MNSKEKTQFDSITYLTDLYKKNKTNCKLILNDKISIECLKNLSHQSISYQLNDEDLTDEYFNILFDLIFTILQNLKENYNLDLFKTNLTKKENVLMLTRLIGTICNFSNNSIQCSRKLNDKSAKINDLFQIIHQIIKRLNTKNECYDQLVCFAQTALDFFLAYFELSKNFRCNSETRNKLLDLNETLVTLNSFEPYLQKFKFFLIRFDNEADLTNDEYKSVLINKFNSFIANLKLINEFTPEIFNNQVYLNGFKFIKRYSKINASLFDTELIRVLVELLKKEIHKPKANKFNLSLIIQILSNYSIKNSSFVIEFQANEIAVKLLFDCLSFFKVNDEKKLNFTNLIENLINLIYFIGKKSHLFAHKWSDCNAIDHLISILQAYDSFNDRVLSRVNQIIKVIHGYNSTIEDYSFDYLEDSTGSIFNYISDLSFNSTLFESMLFRDAVIYLSNITLQNTISFDRLNDTNKEILMRFLTNFSKYSIETIFSQNKNENIANKIKLYSYYFDASRICLKLASSSNLFCTQFQLNSNGIPLILKLISNDLTIKDDNKIEFYLIQTLYKEIIRLVNKIYSSSENVSIANWNSIETVQTFINSSLRFDDKIVTLMLDLITYQFGYKSNEDLINYLKFSQLDDSQKITSFNENISNLIKNDNISIILDKRSCLNSILYLYSDYRLFEKLDIELQLSFIKYSIDFFYYTLHVLNSNLISNDCDELSISVAKTLIYFSRLMSFTCNAANISVKFCSKFHKNTKNGILILFKLLASEAMVKYLINNESRLFKVILKDTFDLILLTLHNLSRIAYKYKPIWEEIGDPMVILFQIANKFKTVDESFQLTTYLILANLASDDYIQKLTENLKQVVKSIIDKIEIIANTLETENSDEIERILLNLNENDDKQVKIIQYNNWHLIELITPLFCFSKCDEIKYLIYNDFNMKDILNKIIYNGNENEQEYAFKLLYQLCFDDRIANDIGNNKKLYDLIQKQAPKVKNCEGIAWVLKNKFCKTEPVVSKTQIEDDKHIMISYNRETRDYCFRMKDELEKLGQKCWIDVENIHGSSLESMANAIEQSSCVLMCMTEKYKESPNCRLEAEYVMQIKKPFVPLIMQKGYKPNGWLGLILGSKIYIDTTKYEFDECIKRLLKEIDNLLSLNGTDIKKPTIIENNKLKLSNWSQSQVKKWLNEKKFHLAIISSLNQSNGVILYKIFEMYTKMPQFVCKKLVNESNNELKLTDLAYFTFELEKLFHEA